MEVKHEGKEATYAFHPSPSQQATGAIRYH